MNQFSAILLAGGQSTRMGEEKTGMVLGGRTLLERSLDSLVPVVSSIALMLNQKQQIPIIPPAFSSRIQIGRDTQPRQGPLQGIADALPFLPVDAKYIYVVTCDLPYLTSDFLISMRQEMTTEVDVVHAKDENITNPLLALYRKKVLMRAPSILASGRKRPIMLWEGQQLAALCPPAHAPLVCRDINTQEELAEARRRFSDCR